MTLVITPTVDTLVNQPRIRLVVSGTSAAPNPVGTASTVVLYRTDPDGRRRRVIVEAGAVLSGGAWVGFDYHMPFNAQVNYSAVVDGVTSNLAPAYLASTVSWLIDQNDPTLSTQITAVNTIGDRVKASTAVLSYAFGSQYPISVSDGVRHSATGSLVVRLASPAEQGSVDALLALSGPVLLNLAASDQGSGWWDESWAWVQPGDITYSNPGGTIYYPYRHLAFPYTVVDTPVGSEVPIWTLADVKANFATLADVKAAFRTLSDLATDTVSTDAGLGLLAPDAAQPGYFSAASLAPDPNNPGYYLPGAR